MDKCENNNLSSGLALLRNYESGSSDDDNESYEKMNYTSKERLPGPNLILKNNFKTGDDDHEDDPNLHEGRTRSFSHVRGNWSTLVYIPYETNDLLNEFISSLRLIIGNDIEVKCIDCLHISLSKTLVLFHHWIDTFVESLRQQLQFYSRFTLQFGGLEVFCNEPQTRTFIGLGVLVGNEELINLVKIVDTCLEEFKLDTFYKEPKFHLSIAWCLGNRASELESRLPKLNEVCDRFIVNNPDFILKHIDSICCRIGNKFFSFPLR